MKRNVLPLLNHGIAAVLAALVLFLTGMPAVHAAQADFTADYDVQYSISPTGTTIVTQTITLTNNSSTVYPKQYSIFLDTDKVKNVIAYDSKGPLNPKVYQHEGKTDITVTFNELVIGMDKTLTFSLRYENTDVAQKIGNIWEVHIPGVRPDPTLGKYTVTLQTPVDFGPIAYMSPPSSSGLTWQKDAILESGINLAFGENQTFLVNLTYPIENDRLTSGIYEIAIPPDTEFQKVSIVSIDPKPEEMKKDEDGNWIARFNLAGGQKANVVTELLVKTSIQPRTDYKPDASEFSQYTKPMKYWESEDPEITKLARTYKTPKDIYNYVVGTLTYDYNKVSGDTSRKGASGALKDPTTSVCTEFTDLFIAIARAAGIPAREVVGYAYTTDSKLRPLSLVSDVLHAWPEYYDTERKMWIPVDPTWASTTGGVDYFTKVDFNHIAFVIHGASSELPYPAGSFKPGTVPRKNVSVKFIESTNQSTDSKLRTRFQLPKSVASGYPVTGKIIVENVSGTNIPNVTVSVTGDPYKFSSNATQKNLPPFGTIAIPVEIRIGNLLARGQGRILVVANGQTDTYTYDVKPMYWLIIPTVAIFVGATLLLWILLRK